MPGPQIYNAHDKRKGSPPQLHNQTSGMCDAGGHGECDGTLHGRAPDADNPKSICRCECHGHVKPQKTLNALACKMCDHICAPLSESDVWWTKLGICPCCMTPKLAKPIRVDGDSVTSSMIIVAKEKCREANEK